MTTPSASHLPANQLRAAPLAGSLSIRVCDIRSWRTMNGRCPVTALSARGSEDPRASAPLTLGRNAIRDAARGRQERRHSRAPRDRRSPPTSIVRRPCEGLSLRMRRVCRLCMLSAGYRGPATPPRLRRAAIDTAGERMPKQPPGAHQAVGDLVWPGRRRGSRDGPRGWAPRPRRSGRGLDCHRTARIAPLAAGRFWPCARRWARRCSRRPGPKGGT